MGNNTLYVGSTPDNDILAHPDEGNIITVHPKGFADANNIPSHEDGDAYMRQFAPAVHAKMGQYFVGSKPPTMADRVGAVASQAMRAPGQAIQYAKDLGRAALTGASQTVNNNQSDEDQRNAYKHPIAATVGAALESLPAGIAHQTGLDTLVSGPRFLGQTADGQDAVVSADHKLLLLPGGHAAANNIPNHPNVGMLLEDNPAVKNIVAKPNYGLGEQVRSLPDRVSLTPQARQVVDDVRSLPDRVSLTPGGKEVVDSVKKSVGAAVRPMDVVDPLRVRDLVVPPEYNDKWGGGGGAGGGGGSGEGGAEGEPTAYPNIAVGTPYERGVASAPQGSYYDMANPPRTQTRGSGGGGSSGGSSGNSGGSTSGGGKNDLLVGHDDDGNEIIWTKDGAQIQKAGFAEANGLASHPNGEKFIAENDPGYKQPYRSFHGTSSGSGGSGASDATHTLIGTTTGGQEIIKTPSGDPVVMPKGTAAAKGIPAHPDAASEVAKLSPKMRSAVQPVQSAEDKDMADALADVSTRLKRIANPPERANDPEWQKWYNERQRKIAAVNANDAETERRRVDAERSVTADVNNARMTADMEKRNADKGGPLPMTDADLDAETARTAKANDLRRAVESGDTEAVNRIQNSVPSKVSPTPASAPSGVGEGAGRGATQGAFNSAFPTIGALLNAVGIGKSVAGVNAGAAQAVVSGATEADRVGAFASAKRLAGMDLTADEAAKADAFEKNPVSGLREAMTNAVTDGLGLVKSGLGKATTTPAAAPSAPGAGGKVKPVIPVGAAQAAPAPAAQAPGAPSGQSSVSVSKAGIHIPGIKGDAPATSESKAQEVENRAKGMADRTEDIAKMQFKSAEDMANYMEKVSQDIARHDATEAELRKSINERAEKLQNNLQAKADELYNTKTDPYRAFRNTSLGQKIALVAGSFLNGFANGMNPGRNGKDAFHEIMDRDIEAQAKDVHNKESGLNHLLSAFGEYKNVSQNKIAAVAMLKASYLAETARTLEIMGKRSDNPIMMEMAKNKADELRNDAVKLGQLVQEQTLKIVHGNQQTQLNWQAIQRNKLDMDLQQLALKQAQMGGMGMGMYPTREAYGHPVVIPPNVTRDPKQMNEIYERIGKIYTAHNATRDISEQALRFLAENKNWGTNGFNTANELKRMVGRVAEIQRLNMGQNSVPTSELFRMLEDVLGKGNAFTPGNYDTVVRAWQDVARQADEDGDKAFTWVGLPPLSALRANRKDVQYGNTPTAQPAPGN